MRLFAAFQEVTKEKPWRRAKMKTGTTFTLFLTAILTLAAGSAFGKYSGGFGIPVAPYRIATKADLLALAANTGDYGKCFILTADINMAGQVFTAPIIAADGVPAFSGTFDGNGHKITNFTINEDYYDIGLFGTISGGSVKNLGIEDCLVSGFYYVGCLAGFNGGGSISNCYSTGSVSGPSYSSNIGCLVGYNNGGSISDCYSTGSAGGDSHVGGLVGSNQGGNISNCYATGSVTGDIIGGLVGSHSDGTISNCYSTGSVSGVSYIGGLVGINYSSISNCYSAGAVSGSIDVGGLVGLNSSGSSVSSFWNTQTSGRMTSAGGTGKTTAQMKILSTFTSAGWDFANVWGIYNGQSYPCLKFLTGFNPVDLNYSGKVDMQDFAIFADNWLAGD
jgi:hypothetical protein